MASFFSAFAARHESRLKELRYSWFLFRHNLLAMAGLLLVIFVALVGLFAPLIAPQDPSYATVGGHRVEVWQPNYAEQFESPSAEHWFGTEFFGIDLFSMVVYGARTSFMIGAFVVFPAMLIGVVLGAFAGYFGRGIGETIMRITDIFLSIPALVLAMAIAAVLGRSIVNIMYALIITWWPWYTRIVYGQVLSLREKQFVEAARSVGAGPLRIIFRHITMNSLSPVIVQATSDFGYVVLTAAGLSFIGLGAPVGTAEWGLMINEGAKYMPNYWWSSVFPGVAILVTVLAFNLLGDGLRDILDPRLRR